MFKQFRIFLSRTQQKNVLFKVKCTPRLPGSYLLQRQRSSRNRPLTLSTWLSRFPVPSSQSLVELCGLLVLPLCKYHLFDCKIGCFFRLCHHYLLIVGARLSTFGVSDIVLRNRSSIAPRQTGDRWNETRHLVMCSSGLASSGDDTGAMSAH